jgi:leucyl-tRNA---protein transferase
VARMPLYRQLQPLSLAEADVRFANAERRVGACLYRTACPTCSECQGIRVVVDDFKPTKSQRRVWNRWKSVRVEYGPVTVSDQKLELFNRHKMERGLTDDGADGMSSSGYEGWLGRSCVPSMEMRYYVEDQLIGVGIVDLGIEGMSSVYFYFDPAPEVSKLSPGVYSVLREIDLCRKTGRSYLYLGLYVADCARLSYKANYNACERMRDGAWEVMANEPAMGTPSS